VPLEVISVPTGTPSSAQLFLVAERCVLGAPNNAVSAVVGLIATYFVFNMIYPKQLYPVLIFLQHFVLSIKDKQPIPNILKRVMSSLDRAV